MAKAYLPIKAVPHDPENAHISRDEFIAKRRKAKELEARMQAFEVQAKADIESEITTKKEDQPGEVAEVKHRGRPRKQ